MKTFQTILRQKLYKLFLPIVGGLFALAIFMPGISLGQFGETPFPYEIQGEDYQQQEDQETNLASLIKEDTNDQQSLLQRLTDYFRLSGTTYDQGTSKAIYYVRRILNMLLWLVSLLSLVMIIFAFYLIFFSKGEEAVTKAKKILTGVAVALAIMGLSRFIASFFFDIYTTIT